MKLSFNDILSNKKYKKIKKEKNEIENLIAKSENSILGKLYLKLTKNFPIELSMIGLLVLNILIGIISSKLFFSNMGTPIAILSFIGTVSLLAAIEIRKFNAIDKLNIFDNKEMKNKLISKKNTQKIIEKINERTEKLSETERLYLQKLMENKPIKNDLKLSLIKEQIKTKSAEEIIKLKSEILNYVEKELNEEESKVILNLLKKKTTKEKEKKYQLKKSINEVFSELEKTTENEINYEKIKLEVKL